MDISGFKTKIEFYKIDPNFIYSIPELQVSPYLLEIAIAIFHGWIHVYLYLVFYPKFSLKC